ncbi:MAG: serine hydrolase, partial [Sphingobacteriales bacterium]
YIIEAVTKTTYEQAVRKYLFTPLQMTHSGFDFMHLNDAHKTTGYIALNAKETRPAPIVDSTVAYAAGSIYATTGDLYRWHRALQNNSVLSKAQQELAYTPVKNRYGYGWVIDSTQGKRRVGHGGNIDGFVSNLSRVPEDDICIIFLSNASDRSRDDITNSIYAILYNTAYELPRERKAVTLPDAVMQQYTGEYEMRPGLTITISVKDNGLAAQPTNQREKFILPEKEDMFFDTNDEVLLQFTRNEQKQVDGFILTQRGRKTVCKKIK